MKKKAFSAIIVAALMCSCATEFNSVFRMQDYDYRYEYAKECFAAGRYTHAVTLLQDLITVMKGTDNAEESLFMLGMAEYCSGDYELASETFKKYAKSYPKGIFAEQANFYVGQSLFESAPEPRLDQTATIGAINAYQQFLDRYPDSQYRKQAQQQLFALQDRLVMKELLSAQLYYDLGGYYGNCSYGGSNYQACIITAENALKTYPYSSYREQFALLVMKAKYDLARQSVEAKKLDRYRDAEDECYGFLNEYPDSKDKALAEKYIAECKKVTKD